MIRTRFGTPVKVMGFDEATGMVTYQRIAMDAPVLEAHASEFRADGGLSEIQAEAKVNA
jgi:hypothetical protein